MHEFLFPAFLLFQLRPTGKRAGDLQLRRGFQLRRAFREHLWRSVSPGKEPQLREPSLKKLCGALTLLRPRIIPCLLVHNGGLVKTVAFKDPKYVGDPINAVKIFNEKEADELVVLDIDATANGAGARLSR